MKLTRNLKKPSPDWSIASTSGVNIGPIKNSELSLIAEIASIPFTPRIADLLVKIKNEGQLEVNNIYVMASVSNGFSLNNPGEIFGTGMRMDKIIELLPKQVLKFKLTIRSTVRINPAFLEVIASPTPNESDPDAIKVSIEINTISLA